MRTLPTLALLALTSGVALVPTAHGQEPWNVLEGVRASLEVAGPTGADFVQTYVPMGFSSGESETGRMAIDLPDCLRWDYEDPDPKHFLLCGEEVYSWNPGEPSGRRSVLDPAREPGLDLLLLAVEGLSRRYEAEGIRTQDGRFEIRLTPIEETGSFAAATIVVDERLERPVLLTYLDLEGNRSTFELSGFRPLDEPELFMPPTAVDWID